VDSHFEGNQATNGDGGAIFTDGAFVPAKAEPGSFGGRISLCGATFSNNRATASAAAGFLFAYGIDQLAINRCEFRGNTVSSKEPGLGGALRIDAEAFVSNSLFVDNQTAGQGGALWIGRGPAVFENVTFYANNATLWGGAISYGNQPVTLNNCTLARNTAGESSDGLFGQEGALTAHNTLLVENGAEPSATRHCRVALQGDHNLVYPSAKDDACGTGVLVGDPLVASNLADNGGKTQTLSLESGSAALDAGTACPATDQRGEIRMPTRCDLGAYERLP
jgi:predicted outer membrane repeat protein